MTKIFNIFKKIFGWFGYVDRSQVPELWLPTCYTVNSNCSPFDISDIIMFDLKNQTYCKIKEDKNLYDWVNDMGIINVHFIINIPIGLTAKSMHTFYWDGDTLYSIIKETKEISRVSAIDSILNS
jgi:hypothetical protein